MWNEWKKGNLLHLVLTWAGQLQSTFYKGSRTVLSNHAFGTAFDINVEWSQFGATPALVGRKVSLRELVKIANSNGFY